MTEVQHVTLSAECGRHGRFTVVLEGVMQDDGVITLSVDEVALCPRCTAAMCPQC